MLRINRPSLLFGALAAALAACGCPEEGFYDHVEVVIDPPPTGDQTWALSATTRADSNCEIELTADAAERTGGDPCPPVRLVETEVGYRVAISGRPDEMHLALTTEGGVTERTVEPRYRVRGAPGGVACGEVLVGEAVLRH